MTKNDIFRFERVIAERNSPRASFAQHDMRTHWDPLHRAYFNGKGWLFRARLAPLCLVPRRLTRPATWPRHDQVDQATTSIALPLTRVSPFKLSTVT